MTALATSASYYREQERVCRQAGDLEQAGQWKALADELDNYLCPSVEPDLFSEMPR